MEYIHDRLEGFVEKIAVFSLVLASVQSFLEIKMLIDDLSHSLLILFRFTIKLVWFIPCHHGWCSHLLAPFEMPAYKETLHRYFTPHSL